MFLEIGLKEAWRDVICTYLAAEPGKVALRASSVSLAMGRILPNFEGCVGDGSFESDLSSYCKNVVNSGETPVVTKRVATAMSATVFGFFADL